MSNDVRVVLDTVKMRTVAKTLENQISIIKNCYSNIGKDGMSLRGSCWEGASADKYYDSMKALCHDDQLSGKVTAGHVVKILQEYVQNLNYAATEQERNEGKVQDRVEALPVSVFDV